MTPKQEAMMRQLLKTMESTHPGNMNAMAQETWDRAIRNLREVLAVQAAQQEPVGAEYKYDSESEWGRCSIEHHNLVQSEPHNWPGYQTRLLFAGPQAHEWVGLTESEKSAALYDADGMSIDYDDYAEAIEAKLKEKNGSTK